MTTTAGPAPNRLTGAGLFVAASFACLFIAEWSVRLALPDYDPASQVVFAYHPAAGTVLGTPGASSRQIKNSGDYNVTVRFNKHGFRDRQNVATGTAADTYVTGDSFTLGWGVEEDERFSSALAKLTGRQVFNISASSDIDGYARALAYAEKLGAKVHHVVLAVNMIDDVKEYPQFRVKARPLVESAPPPDDSGVRLSLQSIKTLLLRESALYFLLTARLGSIEWLRAVLVRIGVVKTIKTISGGLPSAREIESTANRLSELARKYDLLVLVIPSRGLWIGRDRDAVSRIHDVFRSALQKRGIRFVDPRPLMEASGDPMQYHFRNDGHWVPTGHLLAAKGLAARLSAEQSK